METKPRKLIENQILLYHLTSVRNLESILEHGLCSRATLQKFNNSSFYDIANQEIIARRMELGIANYIPFHFFFKNPFDGAVLKTYPNEEFCYITITRKFAQTNNFRILTQHPLSKDATLYNDFQEGFNKIQWDEMNKRDYNDEKCKSICMAEALSPHRIDCKDFFMVVLGRENLELQKLLKSKSIKTNIASHWF